MKNSIYTLRQKIGLVLGPTLFLLLAGPMLWIIGGEMPTWAK